MLKILLTLLFINESIGKTKYSNQIIAMSIFGNEKKYLYGCIENALIVQKRKMWRAWTLRIYYDHLPLQFVHLLQYLEVDVMQVSNMHPGLFWRFYVINDTFIHRFIVRDSDSRLTRRDFNAVEDWIQSGRPFHVLHDHPRHLTHKILGGMWGSIGGYLNSSLIDQFPVASKAYYGIDQDWLQKYVWPIVEADAVIHVSYGCASFAGKSKVMPFPTKRESQDDFVGNQYSPENDWKGWNIGDRDGASCPSQCRKEIDWIMC